MSVFQKIIDREIPCDKLYEDDHIIAFKDIAPQAQVHVLIVPKKAIKDFQSLKNEDLFLLQEVAKVAQKLAKELKIEEAYRLVTNCGEKAGQSVFHLHFHLLGGDKLSHKLA